VILAATVIAACCAAAVWVSSGRRDLQHISTELEQKNIAGDEAVDPEEARERNEKRQRMIVEKDLKTLLHIHASGRTTHYREHSSAEGADLCHQQAEKLFDHVITESAMVQELDEQELSAFKGRFATSMRKRCKDIISERLWLESAGHELEQQKPVMTAKVAASLNGAGLGFKTKMQDWHLHESKATFESRLGYLGTPAGQESVLKRNQTRQALTLPAAFRAELKWPGCKEEILKIHNQGHCGSCWAFGGLASIDARMCIASGGTWDAPRSP